MKDICPGACNSLLSMGPSSGGSIYFYAWNPYVGAELWTSDGTTAGTLLVSDLEPGSGGSSPEEIRFSVNRVYVTPTTSAVGKELFAVCTTAATKLGVTGNATAIAGASVTINVTPLDNGDDPVPCYTGTVQVTSSDPSATLPANHTFVAGEGAHAFQVTLNSLGTRTVTFTDIVTGTIVGSINIVVGASPATSTITANPTSIIANSTSTSTITVQYKNASGANLTTGGGTLELATDAGTLSALVNHNDGTYTATLTSSTNLVTATITGTLNGVAMTDTATVAFTPGPATSFVVTAPATAVGGTPFTITVTAEDANAHTATGYTGTVHFTSSDPSAVLPSDYAFLAGDNGVKAFTNGVTLNSSGSRSITATDTVTATITGSANVTVSGTTTTVVTSTPNPSASGASVTLQATVTSAIAGTITGTVTFKEGTTTLGSASLSSGVASINVPFTSGPHAITAIYAGEGNYSGSTSAAHTHYVTLDAPVIIASASSATSVAITWGALSGAVAYDVLRSTNNAPYELIATPATNSFADNTALANKSYFYKVRGRDAGTNPGNLSTADLATTVIFTDDPIIAGTTQVKTVQIIELRDAVNAFRAFAGLAPATFTDASLTGIVAKTVHITELRTALNAARTALGLGALTFTDPTLTAQSTRIKSAHVTELRDAVR